VFTARVVRNLGEGGQRLAERELGWNRVTVRKGWHELDSGISCVDAFALHTRKRAEDHLPLSWFPSPSDLKTASDGDGNQDTLTRYSLLEVDDRINPYVFNQ